jgi:hypothetical protein
MRAVSSQSDQLGWGGVSDVENLPDRHLKQQQQQQQMSIQLSSSSEIEEDSVQCQFQCSCDVGCHLYWTCRMRVKDLLEYGADMALFSE